MSAKEFEKLWSFYWKLHRAGIVPLISEVLDASEVSSPDLEYMMVAHLAGAIA